MFGNSTENFDLFSQFPTDIQRLIFEEAFEESHRKAIHLALVSREVRSWIEPLIYQSVALNRHTYTKTEKRQFRLFASAFHEGTKSKEFYTTFVQSVFIDDLQKWNLAAEFLPLCSNLRSLACWAQPDFTNQAMLGTILSPERLHLPRLRRLSLYWESLPPKYRTFHHLVFRNLTHLDIDFGPIIPWDGFTSLQNLTYFNLDCIMMCLQEQNIQTIAIQLEAILQIILPHLPPSLRCFVILIPSQVIAHFLGSESKETDMARQIYDSITLGKYDRRIVLGSSRGIPESVLPLREARQDFVHYIVPVPYDLYAWTYLPRGHKDFWMEAEEIRETRKRDLRTQTSGTAS